MSFTLFEPTEIQLWKNDTMAANPLVWDWVPCSICHFGECHMYLVSWLDFYCQLDTTTGHLRMGRGLNRRNVQIRLAFDHTFIELYSCWLTQMDLAHHRWCHHWVHDPCLFKKTNWVWAGGTKPVSCVLHGFCFGSCSISSPYFPQLWTCC